MQDPKFTHIEATRSASAVEGSVIQDLEQRMPENHQYRADDRVTWAHETTHGLQADIRNARFEPEKKRPLNAFYHLDGRAILVREPDFKISTYAEKIPKAVRGIVFEQYIVKQLKWWDNYPLYPWDEWTAYTNGVACRIERKDKENWSETQFMLEMMVYSTYALVHIGENNTSEENLQLERAFRWMANRSFELFLTPQVGDGIVGTGAAFDYWAVVLSHAPELVRVMDRLGVNYPKVMGRAGKMGAEPLVFPVLSAPPCGQLSRDN